MIINELHVEIELSACSISVVIKTFLTIAIYLQHSCIILLLTIATFKFSEIVTIDFNKQYIFC